VNFLDQVAFNFFHQMVRKSLEEIMQEASEQARRNGLTPEILEELLKDE